MAKYPSPSGAVSLVAKNKVVVMCFIDAKGLVLLVTGQAGLLASLVSLQGRDASLVAF